MLGRITNFFRRGQDQDRDRNRDQDRRSRSRSRSRSPIRREARGAQRGTIVFFFQQKVVVVMLGVMTQTLVIFSSFL